MEIKAIEDAIRFIEENITEDLTVGDTTLRTVLQGHLPAFMDARRLILDGVEQI